LFGIDNASCTQIFIFRSFKNQQFSPLRTPRDGANLTPRILSVLQIGSLHDHADLPSRYPIPQTDHQIIVPPFFYSAFLLLDTMSFWNRRRSSARFNAEIQFLCLPESWRPRLSCARTGIAFMIRGSTAGSSVSLITAAAGL